MIPEIAHLRYKHWLTENSSPTNVESESFIKRKVQALNTIAFLLTVNRDDYKRLFSELLIHYGLPGEEGILQDYYVNAYNISVGAIEQWVQKGYSKLQKVRLPLFYYSIDCLNYNLTD